MVTQGLLRTLTRACRKDDLARELDRPGFWFQLNHLEPASFTSEDGVMIALT